MTNSLTSFIERTLPVKSYDSDRNMYLTNGYTSQIGHTYFQGIQLSNRIALVYDIGRGGYGCNPLFLNGVTVYCFDNHEKKIIGKWAPIDWAFYSDSLARDIAAELLLDYLKTQMRMQGACISDSDLEDFAQAQIEAAANNRPSISA